MAHLHTDFFVIVYPHLYDYEKGGYMNEAYVRTLEILDKMKIRYIDLYGIFKDIGYQKLKVKQEDIVYPNLMGHMVAAGLYSLKTTISQWQQFYLLYKSTNH